MNIEVVCSEKSISSAAGEPWDKNLYNRWITFLTTALEFICPEATVEVTVKPGKGAVQVTTYDREASSQLSAITLRLLDSWVIGKDRLCLTKGKESNNCSLSSFVVACDAPVGFLWEPIQEPKPGPYWNLGDGYWYATSSLAYHVYVPKTVPVYEVRVPGQAAWEENIPTFKEALKSQKAAANQGLDADINVIIGNVHLSTI